MSGLALKRKEGEDARGGIKPKVISAGVLLAILRKAMSGFSLPPNLPPSAMRCRHTATRRRRTASGQIKRKAATLRATLAKAEMLSKQIEPFFSAVLVSRGRGDGCLGINRDEAKRRDVARFIIRLAQDDRLDRTRCVIGP
jgi:hypothetical protein